ncbi:hypothetical protein BGZ76_006084 [Entomortierella beljakovae]|nr:hypothetical protein BGZ76_006084 [Entomortierella beljakovae]
MAEVDHSLLETLKDDMEALSKLADKAELELALKRNELMSPVLEKRRAIIAKIPKFWSTVFQLNGAMNQLLEEDDIPALNHLTDVWIKHDSKDPRVYDIVFTFSENPYFTNKELVKKLVVKGEGEEEEPFCEKFEINWKDGKDLTKKRKKDAESDSFFTWFSDDDAVLAQIFANDIFHDALSIYTNEGDDDEFDDGESVDLEDDEDEEEEEEHQKKKSKK